MLDSIQCPVCGKMFIKPQANLYRLKINGKVVDYCSYTCYSKEKTKQDRKKKKRGGFKG